MAYLEASKLNLANAVALARAAKEEEEEKRKLDEGDMSGETGRGERVKFLSLSYKIDPSTLTTMYLNKMKISTYLAY